MPSEKAFSHPKTKMITRGGKAMKHASGTAKKYSVVRNQNMGGMSKTRAVGSLTPMRKGK